MCLCVNVFNSSPLIAFHNFLGGQRSKVKIYIIILLITYMCQNSTSRATEVHVYRLHNSTPSCWESLIIRDSFLLYGGVLISECVAFCRGFNGVELGPKDLLYFEYTSSQNYGGERSRKGIFLLTQWSRLLQWLLLWRLCSSTRPTPLPCAPRTSQPSLLCPLAATSACHLWGQSSHNLAHTIPSVRYISP